MGKRLSIEAYLTVEELEQRYRAARDAVAPVIPCLLNVLYLRKCSVQAIKT